MGLWRPRGSTHALVTDPRKRMSRDAMVAGVLGTVTVPRKASKHRPTEKKRAIGAHDGGRAH